MRRGVRYFEIIVSYVEGLWKMAIVDGETDVWMTSLSLFPSSSLSLSLVSGKLIEAG